MAASMNPKSERKHIGVIGCGAIGLSLTHLLCKSGHDCTVLTRDDSQQTFTVLTPDGKSETIATAQRVLKTLTTEDFDRFDLLIVPVKHYQLAPLLADIAHLLPQRLPLLLLQNGVGGDELIGKYLARNPRFVGITTDAVVKTGASCIKVNARGELLIGYSLVSESGNLSTENVGAQAHYQQMPSAMHGLIAAHPNAHWKANIAQYVYRKLAVNAVINPISARYRCKNGEIRNYPELLNGLKQEVFAIYTHLNLGLNISELNAYIDEVIALTAENYSSMYQDITHQRPSELDGILSSLLQKAAQENIQVPFMQSLFDDLQAEISAYLNA
ncbi:ketopantoate reductase family protein [Glaciecola siphonariae]|uniref:2-dehydropantoate 2-reductase n=1 Tax=Glaciecola siphonariae TaxID=521012 RepID=A0ABV9LUI3_9ALTE